MNTGKGETKIENNPSDKNKNNSIEIGYVPPFWSSKPLHKFSLDVWREGVIIQNIDISSKEFYVIGRNANLSDISLENLTVSRAHCVIQHKDDGEIFLYDLDSVYGTFLNKSQIQKKTYTKLKVGDTFNIGKSSKMFILNGPQNLNDVENEKEDAANISELKEPALDHKEIMQKRIEQIKQQHEIREEYKRSLLGLNSDDIKWGQKDFDEDIMQQQRDEEEAILNKENRLYQEDYDGPFNLEELKERKDLNDKQRNMINKIENLLKGIKNVKEETIKIKKKEMDQGEITEGQKKRLQSNQVKLNDLDEKLETLENNLRISLNSKDEEGFIEQKFDKNLMKELDSEDEYFDRTKKQSSLNDIKTEKNKLQIVITENYETLKVKLESLIKTRQRSIDKLQSLTSNNKKELADNELDSLDVFISETNNLILSEQKTHVTKEIADLTNEINKTQKLLSLVTPSYLKIKASNPSEDFNLKEFYLRKEQAAKTSGGGIIRDQGTLDKEKTQNKKKNVQSVADTMAKLTKIRKKFEIENLNKKFTDSDEEIIEEVQNFREILGKEVVMDESFRKKLEEFKKNLNQKSKNDDSEDIQKGGLILDNRSNVRIKDQVKNKNENLFSEIIENLNTKDFNLENYSDIKNVLYKKKEDRANKSNKQIDYSKGGLQTFQNYLDDVESGSGLLNNKREREKDIYGPSKKPENRNQEEEINQIDDNDYDAIYTVGEKMTEEHDISSNPFKKYNRYEED
jgi:hypothetical protein